MSIDSLVILGLLLVVVGNQAVIASLLFKLLKQPEAPQQSIIAHSTLARSGVPNKNDDIYSEEALENVVKKKRRQSPEVPLPDPAALIKKTTTSGFGSRAKTSEEDDAK